MPETAKNVWLKHMYTFSLCSDFMPSASRGETRVSTHTVYTEKHSHTNKCLLHTPEVKRGLIKMLYFTQVNAAQWQVEYWFNSENNVL